MRSGFRLFPALVALLFLAMPGTMSAARAAGQLDQTPGQRFQIDPAQLPKPYATDAVANVADLISRPDPPPFRLPPGFSANVFASGFNRPHASGSVAPTRL